MFGPQHRRGKMRMVRRIWKMLHLQGKRGEWSVRMTTFAAGTVMRAASTIELKPRLGREDFEHAPATRFDQSSGKRQFGAAAIEHEVMIVPTADVQLIVVSTDVGADSPGSRE